MTNYPISGTFFFCCFSMIFIAVIVVETTGIYLLGFPIVFSAIPITALIERIAKRW